jgi:23S rRNA (guanosine2251-2'-O)-methyltransferase
MLKLGAQKLRTTKPKKADLKRLKKHEIYIILDNVLDTYNVGAIFRLADAIAARKIILCGQTETPPSSRIKKASINTTEWVDWEYKKDALTAIKELKESVKNLEVISVEQSLKSTPYSKAEYKLPLVLVVGHETEGVSREVLNASDKIVEIPLWGVNKSLNVMVSLGIVLYEVSKTF